jgi:hypothetical protein
MSDDDAVILRNYSGCDEVNDSGKSYRVNRWGVVRVPASAVPSLTKTGGFHVARPDDPSAQHSTIDDVLDVVWSLAPGKIRTTLLMLVTNTNAMNYVIQSARPNIRIV